MPLQNDKLMDKNRLSIIIPVYNAEEYLDRCLVSLIEQSFSSYEVILVDDGSTDSSPLICDRYSATDPRFRTIHKKNGGVSSARNAGLDLAKGEFIMFVDSDDMLLPDAVERMFEGVINEDLVVGGYTGFIGGVPHKEVLPHSDRVYSAAEMNMFFDENIRKNCEMLDAPWAKMFRRKTIGDLRFCTDLQYAEDKLFVFGFFARCRSARTCPVPVYGYYIRPGSLGSDIKSDFHLIQLRRFLPKYAAVLDELTQMYPSSVRLAALYHGDLVARYVCRILNIFICRKTALLDEGYIGFVYDLMNKDNRLGLFSIRAGQVFNILLYKIGKVKFSISSYRLISKIMSLFNA